MKAFARLAELPRKQRVIGFLRGWRKRTVRFRVTIDPCPRRQRFDRADGGGHSFVLAEDSRFLALEAVRCRISLSILCPILRHPAFGTALLVRSKRGSHDYTMPTNWAW